MAAKFPMGIAKQYYKELYKLFIKPMEKATQAALKDKIEPLLEAYQAKLKDLTLATNAKASARGLPSRVKVLIEKTLADIEMELFDVKKDVAKVFTPAKMRKLSKMFVDKISVTQKRDLVNELSGKTKLPKTKIESLNHLKSDKLLRDFTTSAINGNVNLINSIETQYFEKLQGRIYDGLVNGESTKSIGAKIAELGGVTERRGQFIARDQLGTIYGGITKQRNQSLGIKRFIWLTSQDERVRDTHAPLEGQSFDWDEGANVGGRKLIPGEDFNCRCTSEMDISELDELFDSWDENSEKRLTNPPNSSIMDIGGERMDFTGASGAIPRNDDTRMNEHAALYYEEIRKRSSDVNAIVKNTDFSRNDIEKIKKHMFFNEYDLGEEEISRFAPDYDMSVSWQRLIDGKDIQEMDIVLLQHELMEYGLMKEQGLSYMDAHAITEKTYNYSRYIKELNKKAGII